MPRRGKPRRVTGPARSRSIFGLGAGSPGGELFDESAKRSWPRRPRFSPPLGWFHDHGRDGRGDQGFQISLNVRELWCIVALVRPLLSLSIGHALLFVRPKLRLFGIYEPLGSNRPRSLPAHCPRECDGRDYSTRKSHALCCEQDFRNLLNQPLRRRRIVTAIFSLSPTPSQGTQEISSKITYKSVFSVSSINPCALSTENGGCTIPKCESARCKRCRMVARAAGAPGRHFQSVTLLPFAVCALEGHGHGVSFGLDRRDYFVELAELWIGGRIAYRAPIPRLVTVPGPNPDTGSRDLD